MKIRTIIIILLKITLILCRYKNRIKDVRETVFARNVYCEKKCGNITHTMCPTSYTEPKCQPYESFIFARGFSNTTLYQILIEGHNGLRNRVAEKMNVSNMLELEWDTSLALMARNYLYSCNHFTVDPCAEMGDIIYEKDVWTEFYQENKSSPQISQNSYYEKSNFYPYKFLERMIREWYFEKESMGRPKITGDGPNSIGRLAGENNFTHFTYPLSHRFGCAMTKYDDAYHVVCNYFPYHRTVTNVMNFMSGSPATNCPSRFPLRDIMFSNLCTFDVGSIFDSASINYFFDGLLLLSFFTTQFGM